MFKKCALCLAVALFATGGSVSLAQSRKSAARPERINREDFHNDARARYEAFRKEKLGEYEKFRKSVLEDYDKFLEGVWEEFRTLKGEERHPQPKPEQAPRVSTVPQVPGPIVTIPEPTVVTIPEPVFVEVPEAENDLPRDPVAVIDVPKPRPENLPVTKPSAPDAPVFVPKVGGDIPEFDSELPVKADFYGMTVALPDIDVELPRRLNEPADYAASWKLLAKEGVAEEFIPGFLKVADAMGLNDWLRYILLVRYMQARYPDVDASSRLSAVHYLMANMGYDVRIGCQSDGAPVMLLPFTQSTVYARPRMIEEQDGQEKYYYIYNEDEGARIDDTLLIYTCHIPENTDRGRHLDLRLTPLNLPYSPRKFSLSFDNMKVEGEMNGNIVPVLFRYPQMPQSDYAQSVVLPELRADVVGQLKQELKGYKGMDAVNRLLHFVQRAYEYQTDQEYFGFEKPMFVEEMLAYNTCDCEDRANFYCYMLWNVLDRPCHLLEYPGHESAAVKAMEPPVGANYIHDGEVFVISDPTYIDAMTGMCMRQFEGVRPQIDYIYK